MKEVPVDMPEEDIKIETPAPSLEEKLMNIIAELEGRIEKLESDYQRLKDDSQKLKTGLPQLSW